MPRNTLRRLLLSTFMSNLSMGTASPFIPLYLRQLGASYALIGKISSCSSMLSAALRLPSGMLADRLGRIRLMLAASLVLAASMWWLWAARSIAEAVPALLLQGAYVALYWPALSAIIADLSPSAAKGYAAMNFAVLFGIVVGNMLGGLVAGALGMRTAFLVAALIAVPAAPLLLMREPRRGRILGLHEAIPLLRRRGIAPLLAYNAAVGAFQMSVSLLTPLVLAELLGFSASTVGYVMMLVTLISAATQLAAGWLAASGREYALASASWLLTALLLIPLMLSNRLADALLLAILLLINVTSSVPTPHMSALAASLAPPSIRAVCFALLSMFWRLGAVFGPALAGYLAEAWGLSRALGASSMYALASALFAFAGALKLPARRNTP